MKTDRFSILQWKIANQTVTTTLFSIQESDTGLYITVLPPARQVSGTSNSTPYLQFYKPLPGMDQNRVLLIFFYFQKIQNRIAYLSFL